MFTCNTFTKGDFLFKNGKIEKSKSSKKQKYPADLLSLFSLHQIYFFIEFEFRKCVIDYQAVFLIMYHRFIYDKMVNPEDQDDISSRLAFSDMCDWFIL